jgi:DNA mismatch endonuclease (patch repair protein)
MPDVFTKRKRSEVMSRIRGRGNRDTELALARLMRQAGLTGWRRHVSVSLNRDLLKALNRKRASRGSTVQQSNRSTNFTVRPDFVFRKPRVAIFVDGCFWHGCPIHSPPARWLAKSTMAVSAGSRKAATARRSGKQFWRAKLTANKLRDRFVNRQLRRQGWRVVRIWEHELTGNPARCLRRIRQALHADQ